jgi:hypothetical protein
VHDDITVKSADNQDDIDDETVAYILSAQRLFEDLRQVAAQLAGLLVLTASRGKGATPDHPMLEAAERLHQSAAADIQSLRPTGRASAHRRHVSQASAALECALSCARGYLGRAEHGAGVNSVLYPLQAACDQLRLAAGALPGFQVISFEQACCGPQIPRTGMASDSRGVRRAT